MNLELNEEETAALTKPDAAGRERARPDRWRWITDRRLKAVSARVWRGVAGAAVVAAAVFAALTYFAMPADRPELEPIRLGAHVAQFGPPPEGWFLQTTWQSIGNKPAMCGFVTVYAADENGARQNKLGARFIGSTDQCETSDLISEVPLAVSDPPDHLLICASYRDPSSKKYWQAFRYRVLPRKTPKLASLVEELPRPSDGASKKLCR